MQNLSLKENTEKIATLLAMVTAHRLQTLALIKTENIVISTAGITIKIPDMIKTSRPSKSQPELYLPFFKERPKLCAATAIIEYLEHTRDLREAINKNLFIATKVSLRCIDTDHWTLDQQFTKKGWREYRTIHSLQYTTRGRFSGST